MVVRLGALLGAILLLAAGSVAAVATDTPDADPPTSRDQQILEIKQQIHALERRVNQRENENIDLKKSNARLQTQTQKQQNATSEQLQTIQSGAIPASFASAVNRFLGRYRFTLVDGAPVVFSYDRQPAIIASRSMSSRLSLATQ